MNCDDSLKGLDSLVERVRDSGRGRRLVVGVEGVPEIDNCHGNSLERPAAMPRGHLYVDVILTDTLPGIGRALIRNGKPAVENVGKLNIKGYCG